MSLVYFYPHRYLRDRQLDTIRHWPPEQVLNPGILAGRRGAQVERGRSLTRIQVIPWKQRLPLLNIKRRPKGIPPDAVVYTWGAVLASGPFIVDLDNPYALTAYNPSAMSLYRRVVRRMLDSPRCVGIRCLSQACRETLKLLFGQRTYSRAIVQYPIMRRMASQPDDRIDGGCRFLFIGTQFEIKGGVALLKAFKRVHESEPTAKLTIVTHMPPEYASLARQCSGITVHDANLRREEVFERFMRQADVLVHPSYMESFGMVVLEAMAHGLAVVGTDVYALREMIEDGQNGVLLKPPISIWDGCLPSRYYREWPRLGDHVRRADTKVFEDQLAEAMLKLAINPDYRRQAKRASLKLFEDRFEREPTRVA